MFIILFCSFGFYGFYPFINGSGCDFYAETEDEFRSISMSCFAGVLTSAYQKKTTGDIYIAKSIWGKKGNTVYVFNYNNRSELGSSDQRKKFLPSFMNATLFSSYKFFEASDGGDVVTSDNPVMRTYKLERVGNLSWL
ncbi:MAG: hypothetical protein ACRCXB_03505 [Aeromonadaceae bacterium]